ncbi:MFS transporter [Citrobacter rodentium]|uniref:Major Facilitator Superfamily transporter n=2 Tax=Citrobacter rodentium TaxID=67825 RepID=D2TGV7_CITRI|nr:MFS transporter [Citrobacter rodentium]KIQ51283.1 symporter YagG [Citrobacter rodentium]QBY27956.1 MFS transporter [Citrobacter rodentium]UHO30162.1 MFS transporter [Citrobacter rodentium NBRC 105723 = DSM 16636]CBG88120.1 Major Facilitator Superfamily transporter [Citrobacter rodentium ICC168]HAT8012470.1 MFS transporter [Citrobacter rodentium NBRC 105723 = DSM 16636]
MMITSVLTTRDKIGYGLGDMASALVWQTATLFLAFFYTDVFGLPAAVMGTMFLLVRAIDAFVDPCIGALVDRTQTRHGRFRPWLLWFAIPFGVSCIITFYVPDASATAKTVYACLTYGLLSFIYSAINVPYCAMPGALTMDPHERHSLQSWRFGLSFIGGLIVIVIALPLVAILGKGDAQKGYFYAMSLMGVLGIALFFACFLLTKERFTPRSDSSGSMWGDLKLLAGNGQWRIVFIFNIMLLTAVVTRGSATMYYVKYVLLRPDMVFTFIVSGMIAALLGALLSARLLGKFDRVRAYQWTIVTFVIFASLIFFIPPGQVWTIFALNIAYSFIQNLTTPLQWTMFSDVVDYEEQRSGRRLDGLVFSTALFAIKFGLALGGAVVGWLLAAVDYAPNAAQQSATVLTTINALFSLIPAALFLGMALLLMIYKLNSQTADRIARELAQKRHLNAGDERPSPALNSAIQE